MLHTKFQGHRSVGLREDDFYEILKSTDDLGLFHIWAKGLEGGHLGYVTQLIYINFLSNSPENSHMNCGFKSSFSF